MGRRGGAGAVPQPHSGGRCATPEPLNKAAWLLPGTEAPEEWGGEVELALFRSPTLVEAAFLLRGPRALLLADAAFRMDASCGAPRGEIWQACLNTA